MQRGQYQVSGETRLHRDLRGFQIADFPDHDDVGILAQDGAQGAREVELDLRVDLRLPDAVERKLDGVLDGHHVERAAIQARHRRVERGRLARTGRAGNEHDAMRLADQAVDRGQGRIAHPERGEVKPRGILVQQAQHHALARAGGQGRHAHVDALVAELQRHASILRHALFGDVEARHHLQPRHQRRVQRARRLDHVVQHAIDPEAHHRAPLVGLEMQVRRLLAQGLQQQRVDHPDHRRVGGRTEQILRLRNVLQQPGQIGVAGQILAELRDRRGLVVGVGKLRGEALGIHRHRLQRSLQHALQLGDAFDRGIAAGEDEHRIAVILQRQHAMRAGEGVGNAPRGGRVGIRYGTG